jgi:dolichol kinase
MTTLTATAPLAGDTRLSTARRVFLASLAVNSALTLLCVVSYFTGFGATVVGTIMLDGQTAARILWSILIITVVWGFIWLGIKALLLAKLAKFSREERRAAFGSRMREPFDLAGLLARHSERRIRIIDMIGRRGRFITLGAAGVIYLFTMVDQTRPANFAYAFLSANLVDGVATLWVFLAAFWSSNWFSAAVFGPQSRVMDGVLGRANCLSLITLWALFKFVMVPIGAQLATLYPPQYFALVFMLIWGSYMITDTLSEVGGALYGTQKIRVIGLGDVNRKSIAGTVTGFIGGLVLCVSLVGAHSPGGAWFGLAVTIAVSNSLLELWSPRGTDDFTMATANALICWAFGAWVFH